MNERTVDDAAAQETDETVVQGLTATEADHFKEEYRKLHNDILFVTMDVCLSRGVDYYDLGVNRRDVSKVLLSIADIVEKVQPIEKDVAKFESFTLQVINEMEEQSNYEWSREEETPIYRMCVAWAHGMINRLFRRMELQRQIDLWIDDFHPQNAGSNRHNRMQASGECWCGRGSTLTEWKGEFELWIDLNESRTCIDGFELCFADAFTMTENRVIRPDAPDLMIDQVGCYRVAVQKAHREGSEKKRRWAFQISKIRIPSD